MPYIYLQAETEQRELPVKSETNLTYPFLSKYRNATN